MSRRKKVVTGLLATLALVGTTMLSVTPVTARTAAPTQTLADAAVGDPGTGEPVNAARLNLDTKGVKLSWRRTDEGWALERSRVRSERGWTELDDPVGEYTVVHSVTRPPAPNGHAGATNYAPGPVDMDAAGTTLTFLPERAYRLSGGALAFERTLEEGVLRAVWNADPEYGSDISVQMDWTASVPGYVSIATPTVVETAPDRLEWGIVPGAWQGDATNPDFEEAFRFGQGLPDRPGVRFEHMVTTLAPSITASNGITISTIADPGTAAPPWNAAGAPQRDFELGLSTMDRASRLAPTMYHPVLGRKGSATVPGDVRHFGFRLSMVEGDWWEAYTHAVKDVYRFNDALALKDTEESLSDRLEGLQPYLRDPGTSLWRTDEYEGATIGAQDYNGYVAEQDNDAMKNSDVGSMWMWAETMADRVIENERLPFVESFKLAQQQTEPGFFQGGNKGQYYLYKSDRFVEEGRKGDGAAGGAYVEPLALTYYTLIDMGNILKFQPNDQELLDRLRLAADRLLTWQRENGSWTVAYQRDAPHGDAFPELDDLRPTWYGLYIAHDLLGDDKYLAGAQRGADWFVENAVERGHYLGSTGDSGFLFDLSVSGSAQGLLDLSRTTGEERYREAAVDVAKLYATVVYTHPIPTDASESFKGRTFQHWQVAWTGLQKEHNETVATAGPILLNTFAPSFLRFAAETGDDLFADMARMAVIGRDEFVDDDTKVTSYYWNRLDAGAGPFPHHAWWQVGWISDYLVAEAELRSNGAISFPRGYFTPKVGGQQTVGFGTGDLYGEQVQLWNPPGMANTDEPMVEHVSTRATTGTDVQTVLINQATRPVTTTLTLDESLVRSGYRVDVTGVEARVGHLVDSNVDAAAATVEVPAQGMAVVRFRHTAGTPVFGPTTVTGPSERPTVSWAMGARGNGLLRAREVGTTTWQELPAAYEDGVYTAELDLSPSPALPYEVEYQPVVVADGVTYEGEVGRRLLYPSSPSPDTNVARGASVSATSQRTSSSGPDRAVDGNTTSAGSRWLTSDADTTPALTVQLAEAADVYLLRLHSGFADADDVVQDFRVEALQEGAWTEVAAVNDNRSRTRDVTLSSPFVRAQDWRLVIDDPSNTSPDIARVYEVELFRR